MNGKIPKFLEGRPLPEGYYDTPDPYSNPADSPINLRALMSYANEQGKEVVDLTHEEVEPFYNK